MYFSNKFAYLIAQLIPSNRSGHFFLFFLTFDAIGYYQLCKQQCKIFRTLFTLNNKHSLHQCMLGIEQ